MGRIKTRDIVWCGLFTALIAAGAFIRIPVPVVPFTLQFLFTTLAGLLLGGRIGAVSVGAYVVLGLIGLPIFAEGGGFWYITKPSFGYLIGFIPAAYTTGKLAEKTAPLSFRRILGANFAGLGIVYTVGMAYYYIICNYVLATPIAFWPLVLYGFLLAVPGDIVLCFLAAVLAKHIKPVLLRQGGKRKMDIVTECKQQVLDGKMLSRTQALALYGADLERLTAAADEIRRHFCGGDFDICTIVNGKCGNCSEDCKYCAQSARYRMDRGETYPLLSAEAMLRDAKAKAARGVLRYSIVTSGKRLSDAEVDDACESVRAIRRETSLAVCVSFGLLDEAHFRKLRAAGVSRVHCNLESSQRYFPEICTTHTYDEKVATLQAAARAGLSVCSGGILGLGETAEDRIDMALAARALGIRSIPLNVLNPIPGTPYENRPPLSEAEIRRCVALFRFLLPDASIRLAGGRGLMRDGGRSCFTGGANAVISGDMLTTAGITIESDLELIHALGYTARLCNG